MTEGGIGTEDQRPNIYEENKREDHKNREGLFGSEIRDSFDRIVKSLERLGMISSRKMKEPPYNRFSNTGKDSSIDLRDLPSPVNSQIIMGKPILKPKMDAVTFEFRPGDPDNKLNITWKGPNYEEVICMHGYRPDYKRTAPYFFWSLHTTDERGREQIDVSQQFSGKLSEWSEPGKPTKEFSVDYKYGGYKQVPVFFKEFVDLLEKKTKQVPHSNPVARFFGR